MRALLLRRLVIPLLVLASCLFAVPAFAADSPVTIADIGPGTCTPQTVAPFTAVDCRFSLRDSGLQVDPFNGAFADLDLPYDELNGTRSACHVDGRELVCPSVGTFITPGTRTVSIDLGFESTDPLASFEVVDGNSLEATFTATRAEPLVFSGRPLEMWVGATASERVWALVTERATGRPVGVFDVGEADADDLYAVDLASLLPGRYRVAPCVGESAVGCRRVTGGVAVQVGTGRLEPVGPGLADPDADRINIVFAGSGFDTIDEVRSMAIDLLTLSGPVGMISGRPAPAGSQPLSAVFGPFATEPLASSRHLFNLWVLTDLVADPKALHHGNAPRGNPLVGTDGFDLPLVQITTLHLQQPGSYSRSEAGWTSLDGTGAPDLGEIAFAGAYLSISRDDHWSSAPTLTHEWGHALFDLRDEYVEWSGRGVTHGYPNCAPDLETAMEWWGDLEGAVDPFVEGYADALSSLGLWFPDWITPDLTTAFVTSAGCYSADEGTAVRPTADSIMNSSVPIFGAVNRRQVEAVLELVDGRAPIGSGDVVLVCDRTIVCQGSVRALVDAPADGLVLDAGDVSVPCSIAERSDGPGLLTCVRVDADPDRSATVRLLADGVEIASAPVPTTTTTSTTSTTTTLAAPTTTAGTATTIASAPAAAGDPGDLPGSADPGSGGSTVLAAVAIALVVLVGGAWAKAARRRS